MYRQEDIIKKMERHVEFIESLVTEIHYLTRDLQLHAERMGMINVMELKLYNKKMLAKADRLTDAYSSLIQAQQYLEILNNELFEAENDIYGN